MIRSLTLVALVTLPLLVGCKKHGGQPNAAAPQPAGGNGSLTRTSGPEGEPGPYDEPALGAELFPTRVGGFAFGGTPDAFRSECEASGGSFVTPETGGSACTQAAVALPAQVQLVGATFCGDRVCEFQLVTQQIEQWAAVLEDKYGAPHAEGAPETCKNPTDRGRAVRKVWYFGRQGAWTGILRVIRDCDTSGKPFSIVTYENSAYLQQRAQEDAERKKNY